MSLRSIPAALEPAVLELVRQKKSVRQIAVWLRTEHEIQTTHMSVHRLVERLRDSEGTPDVEAELAAAKDDAAEQLRTLKELAEQFAELAERALLGDEALGLKPNLRLAGQYYSKQAALLKEWFRRLALLNPPAPRAVTVPAAKPATPAAPAQSPVEPDPAVIAQLQASRAELNGLMEELKRRTLAL